MTNVIIGSEIVKQMFTRVERNLDSSDHIKAIVALDMCSIVPIRSREHSSNRKRFFFSFCFYSFPLEIVNIDQSF